MQGKRPPGLVIYCTGMAVVMGVLAWASYLDHRRGSSKRRNGSDREGRQLTLFCSTAFLTALSRAERTDPPVLTSMNAISISSTEALSPLERNEVDWSAKKTNVLGVEIEARQVWHDVLGHLASSDS